MITDDYYVIKVNTKDVFIIQIDGQHGYSSKPLPLHSMFSDDEYDSGVRISYINDINDVKSMEERKSVKANEVIYQKRAGRGKCNKIQISLKKHMFLWDLESDTEINRLLNYD